VRRGAAPAFFSTVETFWGVGMPLINLDELFEDLNRFIDNPQDYNRIIGKVLSSHQDALSQISSGALVAKAGSEVVGNGVASKAVVFPVPMSDINYSISAMLENTLDVTPQYQFQMLVTAKSVNGFTVSWPALTDSANYKLNWTATPGPTRAGQNAIPNAAASLAVVFPTPMPSANYALSVMMENTLDVTPQYQFQILIKAKSASGFTASWPSPVDSANYKLNWTAIPN